VTSTSAQELLAKAGTTVDRLNELLNPDNIQAVSDSVRSINTTLAGIAKQDGAIQSALAQLPGAVSEFNKTFAKLDTLANTLSLVAMEIGPQDAETKKALAGKQPGELRKALTEARAALGSIDGAAGQLNKLIGDSKGPLKQFSENGLVELSFAIRELRQLTSNLNIIATKLERDPANFLFTGKQGYSPK
jgi:phospholipid/cholesterol/gamma-HCH transport system substrate-binding protein